MSVPVTEPSPGSPFGPGDLFAGRYRMVTRLGRWPMGEVWRADDLVLQTPVALKLWSSASADARERVISEVRVARQITHPAICRVYDVGEADGELFYSMELVRGEDLATLLRRAGRLPSEKVCDIGGQICAGLAAAHSHGVLHRDLRPANVLIDEYGAVRITDFGIAVGAPGEAAQADGASPYLAPEQRVAGGRVTERTDIYALGAVLYELLDGVPPPVDKRGATKLPPGPSSTIADVDPRLERAIMRALAPEPDGRFASMVEMAAALESAETSPVAPPRPWSRPWLAGAALAAVVVAAAIASAWLLPRGSRALTDRDTIVIADFLNTTGDPVFDGALKVALAVALEQSPFVKVFPEDSVHDTLRLMQRDPAIRVTRAIAREIALREQLKALVAGSIGSLGSHYVIALEAINAQTGDVMAREQAEAASKEDVLATLGAATARLREKLGESLSSINRFDVPLARATTTSLEALNAYSLALDQGRIVPRLEAIPHLQRAIELDPDFALAHALLSGVYANTGRSADAPRHSRKAFELRDRVSERERFFISWRYYIDAAQAWDQALSLAQSWASTYPREPFAFNSLGLASAAFGQHDQAADAFRQAIRLDARFVPPYGNLAGSLMALNRFDEANALLGEAASHGVDFVSIRRMSYLLAFIAGDAETMRRELELARRRPDAVWASSWEARAKAFSGQFTDAHALFQEAVTLAARDDFREFAAQWTMEDAEAHAIAGDCGRTVQEVADGLAYSRDNFTLERASRALAICGAGAEAGKLTTELATRFPTATLTTRLQIPVTSAALALSRGEPARAIALLEPVKPYDRAPAAEFWPNYLRGRAYLAMRDAPAAAEQFRAITDRRGADPTSPLYPLAHLGLARAATLAADGDAARRESAAFFALWNTAEQSPIAAEARREYPRHQ